MCLQGPQSAAINAEVFSRGTDNVQLLLGLLAHEPADFYVQYHTVRLLTCLAAVSSLRVQEVRIKLHILTERSCWQQHRCFAPRLHLCRLSWLRPWVLFI